MCVEYLRWLRVCVLELYLLVLSWPDFIHPPQPYWLHQLSMRLVSKRDSYYAVFRPALAPWLATCWPATSRKSSGLRRLFKKHFDSALARALSLSQRDCTNSFALLSTLNIRIRRHLCVYNTRVLEISMNWLYGHCKTQILVEESNPLDIMFSWKYMTYPEVYALTKASYPVLTWIMTIDRSRRFSKPACVLPQKGFWKFFRLGLLLRSPQISHAVCILLAVSFAKQLISVVVGGVVFAAGAVNTTSNDAPVIAVHAVVGVVAAVPVVVFSLAKSTCIGS